MRKFIIATVLAAAASAVSHAQIVSVYATFSPTHLTNVYSGCTGSPCSAQYTDYWASGIGGGATLNFINLHVVKLGLDLRGSTKSGTTGADTAEVSLRLGAKPPLLPIKPYVQAGVGYLDTRTLAGSGTFESQYATANIHAGVDMPVFPFVDLRLVEIGYGQAFSKLDDVSFGTSNKPKLFTVNTGIVVHF